MKNFLWEMFQEFEWIFWIGIWLCVFGLPILALRRAISILQKKSWKRALPWFVLTTLILSAIGYVLRSSLGDTMIRKTTIALGVEIFGILIGGTICIGLYPMTWLGKKLRLALSYRRAGYWKPHGRKAVLVGILGILVLVTFVVVLYVMHHGQEALVLAFAGVVSIWVGWSGEVLIPESLEPIVPYLAKK